MLLLVWTFLVHTLLSVGACSAAIQGSKPWILVSVVLLWCDLKPWTPNNSIHKEAWVRPQVVRQQAVWRCFKGYC